MRPAAHPGWGAALASPPAPPVAAPQVPVVPATSSRARAAAPPLGRQAPSAAAGAALALGAGAALSALGLDRRRPRGRGAATGCRASLLALDNPRVLAAERAKQSKEPRGSGVVKAYDPERGRGLISFDRLPKEKDVHFTQTDLPKGFLGIHGGQVPTGILVEFDLHLQKEANRYHATHLVFPTQRSLAELGLTPEVIRGASAALGIDPRDNPDAPGLIVPAPVQVESIPKLLQGEDLVIAAETGSGKTLAYMLPLVQQVQVLAGHRNLDYGLDLRPASPLALVLCPTRELAEQAARIMKLICHQARLRVRLVHGGTGTLKKQKREIAQIVDVLVATPDRLLKLYKDRDVKFHDIVHIAIDEADFLLTQGFGDLQDILKNITEDSRRKDALRYTLITASITKPLWKIFQEDPRWRHLRVLESRSLHKPQANCSHTMLVTKGRDKLQMLISLLRPEITGNARSRQTLVFCNTISSCRSVAYQLQQTFETHRNSQYISALHKEMEADERAEVLHRFARGELRVVVCTDIAQRGLDMPHCGHVICFDFPLNSIDYLHRAGRTARFGEPGKVTSFVKKGDKYLARAIEKSVQLGKPINDLSGDKRDYLRGGSLYHLLQSHKKASREERGLPPPRPYDGGLR